MRVSPLDVAASLFTGGQFTPFHALARIYDRAELRTSVTSPHVIDVASLDDTGSGEPSWIVKFLRPTLILSGPEGTKVIAPAGAAGSNGGIFGILALAALIGVPFYLGATLTRR